MGQKVNPTGLRIGFNKNWTSHWFSPQKSFSRHLQEDHAIRTIVNKRYSRSGLAQIEIFRHRGEILINLLTSKPGVIIGRAGAGAQDLKAKIEKAMIPFYENTGRPVIRLNIVEMKQPELSARIVADSIASQLERRISVKRAIKQSIERSMEKGAKGIKIRVSGRLNGAEIARSEEVSQGSVPLQTIRSNISYALSEAVTTYGVIGVKVWIYLGEAEEIPVDTVEPSNRKKSR